MTLQFVDTYYLLALLNSKDKDHAIAVQQSHGGAQGLITTTWVLVEFADAPARRSPAVSPRDSFAGFRRRPTSRSFRRLRTSSSELCIATSNAPTRIGR